MFEQWVHPQCAVGLGKAAVVCARALAVAWRGHLRKLQLGRETAVALLRGLLQMLAIGLVLVWLLKGAALWSVPALAAMCAAAAWMAHGKVHSVPHAYWLCLRAIGTGSAVVIVAMVLAHVIPYKATALVPLGSMIIANSMNTCSQVLGRYSR